jgi:uncharacterized protein YndB with AHSA1/START domain
MTSTSRNEGLLGTVFRTTDGRATVRMADVYDTDIDDLWAALTEPARLARWIAEVDGDLRVGGLVQARFTSSFEGTCRIDRCDAPHRLTVTSLPGTDEETVIEATLEPAGGGTHLVVEERGLPVDEVAAHGAGWQAHVEDLAAHLHGTAAANWQIRWQDLLPAYRDLELVRP